tara:strand:+ start:238 stop:762 length:525 start_codon:yes stop_codon:yes gene_type:complete
MKVTKNHLIEISFRKRVVDDNLHLNENREQLQEFLNIFGKEAIKRGGKKLISLLPWGWLGYEVATDPETGLGSDNPNYINWRDTIVQRDVGDIASPKIVDGQIVDLNFKEHPGMTPEAEAAMWDSVKKAGMVGAGATGVGLLAKHMIDKSKEKKRKENPEESYHYNKVTKNKGK